MNKTLGAQGAGAVPAGLALAVLLALLLVGCGSPQPLPVAPTPIPTLQPAPPPAAVEPTAQPVPEGISFPGEPPSAPDGGAVYSSNCATCHGADGKGLVEGARDFNDLDYMRAAAPADFYASITNGKGKMPAFKDQLSDGDRWNATYYLWHWSVPDAMLAEGDKIFQTNCASCHGADGSGAIPQAPKLTDVEFISSYPAAQFFKSVSGGKGIMPAWQGRLSDDERWAAVERVRTFAYQPAAAGAPPSQPTQAPPTQAPPTQGPPTQGPPTQGPPTQAPEPTAAPTEAPTAATAPQPTEAPAATQTPAASASSGDAAAGKQAWAAKPCLGCHGANAEGGFGPKLAGTALTLEEVQKAVRNGRTGTAMAAFGESQITDKELIDIYAWLKSQ